MEIGKNRGKKAKRRHLLGLWGNRTEGWRGGRGEQRSRELHPTFSLFFDVWWSLFSDAWNISFDLSQIPDSDLDAEQNCYPAAMCSWALIVGPLPLSACLHCDLGAQRPTTWNTMWQSIRNQEKRGRKGATKSLRKTKSELGIRCILVNPNRTLWRWKPKPKPKWENSFSSLDSTMGTFLCCGLESWMEMTTTCELVRKVPPHGCVCGASLRIISADIRERNTACCVVHFTNGPEDIF